MIRKPSSGRSPIGLDIDGRWFTAVQVSRQNGETCLEAALALPRLSDNWPPSPLEIQRLNDVLARHAFEGHRLCLAIPGRQLLTGMLDAPPVSSGAPIQQIARMELARIHKRDPASLELHCWELPTRQRGGAGGDSRSLSNLMAAGAAIEDMLPLLDAFEHLHWDVHQLNIRSWAMVRACASMCNDAPSTALLNIGWSCSKVALLHKGVVVYHRTLEEAGLSRLRARIQHELGCSAEAADFLLVQSGPVTGAAGAPDHERQSHKSGEVSRSIAEHLAFIIQEVKDSCSYMSHQFADAKPRDLIIAGPGASVSGAVALLDRGLDMQVRVATPAECLSMPPERLSKMDSARASAYRNPALVVALGLALAGADHAARGRGKRGSSPLSSRPSINLVPRSRQLLKRRRRRKQMWATVIGSYALLVLAGVMGSRVLHVFDSRALAYHIKAVESQITKAELDTKAMRTQLKQVRDTWATANVVNSQPDWSYLLALLASAAADDVVVRQCDISSASAGEGQPFDRATTLNETTWRLNLSGRSRSLGDISRFVLSLEQLEIFTQVRLLETRREPAPGDHTSDSYAFLIDCTMQ